MYVLLKCTYVQGGGQHLGGEGWQFSEFKASLVQEFKDRLQSYREIVLKKKMCICMYTTCMPGVLEGQQRTSDPLGLELQMVVNCHVGTSSQTQVLCKNNKCS